MTGLNAGTEQLTVVSDNVANMNTTAYKTSRVDFQDIWYATNGEIYDYVQAYQKLRFSAAGDFVYNPSAMDVYICYFGKNYKIPSGATMDLETL